MLQPTRPLSFFQTQWNCIVWFKADSVRTFNPHRKFRLDLFQSKPIPQFKKNPRICSCMFANWAQRACVYKVLKKKTSLFYWGCILKATRHFLLLWEFGDSLQMILSFTRHKNKFGGNTDRFLAEFYFTLPYVTMIAIQGQCFWLWKGELMKAVPQCFVQDVWPQSS